LVNLGAVLNVVADNLAGTRIEIESWVAHTEQRLHNPRLVPRQLR